MKKSFSAQSKFLRVTREKRNLSQGDVSKYLGLRSPQLISNCERGIVGIPINRIMRLAKLFKISHKKIVRAILQDEEAHILSQMLGESIIENKVEIKNEQVV
jgi:transcriptional regulator with XRE-family HTH domain